MPNLPSPLADLTGPGGSLLTRPDAPTGLPGATSQPASLGPLDGLGGFSPPNAPTPGVSPSVGRVPTAPTLPDDPTLFTAALAQLATTLYGVDGAGIDGAPERLGLGQAPQGGPSSPHGGALPSAPQASAPTTRPTVPAVSPQGHLPADAPFELDAADLSLLPGAPTGPAPSLTQAAAPEPSHELPYWLADRDDLAEAPTAKPDELSANGVSPPLELDPFAFQLPLSDDLPAAPARPTSTASAPAGTSLPTVRTPSYAPLPPHLGLELGPAALTTPEPPTTAPRKDGAGFDPYALREEFPILKERVHGGLRLVWLDNAATTQKPQAVIDRLSTFYSRENSNIHRAAHALAARATDAYEAARESVRRFVNARSTREVVFVRGTTEGINLIAQSWGRRFLEPGDEIVITWLEHHANIVPWQLLAKERGLKLKVAPVDDRGQVQLDAYERLFTSRTKLASVTQVSNALGTITPAKALIDIAHRHGAKVVLDGAQSVSHMRVDLQALDCDFFVFSGHKVFAPTGIGAVVAKEDVLETMPPWQGGGNMISDVTFERTLFHGPPARFEAGTGNIADAVGLGAALDWLTRVGIDNVSRHEHELLEYGTARLAEVPGLHMVGTAAEKAGVLSFTLDGHATQDVATWLDKHGIAVRGGHHCAQPILRRFGLESTVRASLAPYNVREDLDALVEALMRLTGDANAASNAGR